MEKNRLLVGFHQALSDKDTDKQTYGCRANNPDICSNNMIPNVCAFASKDCICRKPSRAWKKQYYLLKGREDGIE